MFRPPHRGALFRSALARGLFTRSAPPPRSTPIRNAIYGTVFVLSAGLFTIYYLDARSGIHRYVFAPLLRHTLDAETGHRVAVQVLRRGLGPRDPVEDDVRLKSELWGLEISNPVGLAAGFDKNGEAIDGLFNLGFSWVEIGSVTPKPQAGNPRPRVFHLPEDAGLINRYGFPSEGHASVLSRLRARIPRFFGEDEVATAAFRPGAVLAVNLGKNKESPADSIDDFVAGVRTFGPYSDVLVVNVSSPNTPGLRRLLAEVTQAREELPASTRRPKLVLKIAPDLTEAQLVEIAGVIQNTTIDWELLAPNKIETGGLSGAPLKQYSLAALRTLRKNLPARIPLIGCGASLVQVYTGFGYDGAGACRRIKDQLVDELAKEGLSWAEVVNKAVSELSLQKSARLRRVEKVLADDANPSLKQLISEAEELKTLLDQFGERQEIA
ncbi:hypothetical protein B0H16DRAFT_1532499 [Mycena metata]|uniref:Dihydroorotate dehydrogenase (quinone), mitochondrial n=1 Tax=Mycena metata TaxID=1033252 RepID=A0AAD7JE18_9AGAR|nr:hypothetical protein B0H16DRAFT_1532499 [Mycena metata]